MNIREQARRLSNKYPSVITAQELREGVEKEEDMMPVFKEMCLLAQEERDAELFGANVTD